MRWKPRFFVRNKCAVRDAQRLVKLHGSDAYQEAIDRAQGRAFDEYKSSRYWMYVSEKIKHADGDHSIVGNIRYFVTMISAPRTADADFKDVNHVS